jgi:hypothetical protein
MVGIGQEASGQESGRVVRLALGLAVVVAVGVSATVSVGTALVVALLIEILRSPSGGIL